MSNAPNQLSFLPDDYLERKAQRRSNALCAGLFLVVMLAMGSAFALTERSLRGIEGDYARVDKEFNEAAARIKQVQEMQDKQRRMAYQADLTASLLEKVPRSYLVAEITNAMPPGVSLLDMALDSKVKSVAQGEQQTAAFQKKKPAKPGEAKPEAPKAQPKALDTTLKVSGVADSDVQVAQFINRLSRSHVLRDVNLVISDEYKPTDKEEKTSKDEAPLRRFVIEMSLEPNATVQPNEAKVVTSAVELK
jgi:Tfp pilus assembly protein PilN